MTTTDTRTPDQIAADDRRLMLYADLRRIRRQQDADRDAAATRMARLYMYQLSCYPSTDPAA